MGASRHRYHPQAVIAILLIAGAANATTISDSWLGRSSKRVPAGTQFLSGPSVYVHLTLSVSGTNSITVKWYRNAKFVKSTTVAGTRPTAYTSATVTSLPGNWTVVLTDNRRGFRRSHHFVVK